MPVDCGVVGEMRNIVSQLVDGLQTHTIHQNWVKQIQQCKEAWSIQNENEGNESGYPLHPSRIIRIVEKHVTPNTIIALDEGDSTLWFMRNFRGECEHVLLSKRWRTMGSGLPAALAAKLCMPDKQIICITGDGGLAMVLADLLTAARYQLKMTLIVFNNGTLQMERNKMLVKGFQTEGTDITNPDFAGLAKACGWDAHRIQSGDDLNQKIKLAQSSQSPVLLDVPTAQVSYPNYQII